MAIKHWVSIPGFPSYEFNQYGEVRSYNGKYGYTLKRPRKLVPYGRGPRRYPSYGLYFEGKRVERYQQELKRYYGEIIRQAGNPRVPKGEWGGTLYGGAGLGAKRTRAA